jgi:hypothetical protein
VTVPVGVLAWALWALAMLGLPAMGLLDHLLRAAGRPELAQFSSGGAPIVVAVTSAATIGALVASRRPRHPVGWLLLALGLSATAGTVTDGYGAYGVLARPGALPGAGMVALYSPATLGALLTCLAFVLLLTPTGSPPSPRWRWWVRITAAAPLVFLVTVALAPEPLDLRYRVVDNPLGLAGLGTVLAVANTAAGAITVLAVLAAAGSLVLRFRRARGAERQQLRWVALAAGLSAVAAVAVIPAVTIGNPDLIGWAAAVCVAILPPAIGAAILRYRLYDLDRIISRTLAYGLLTLLLGGAYAGLVLGLGQLLGHDSPLVVAVATLAVAAAFQPARRRVQDLVDRRFNRRRYDAARTIQGFSARLRQQVDLDTLTAELLGVVEQTMQPTRASLWLRAARPSTGQWPP